MHPGTTQLALHAGHHSGLVNTLQMSDMDSDSLETSSTSQALSVGHSVGRAALHTQPTGCMCVYNIRLGGYKLWFVNTAAADGKSQR